VPVTILNDLPTVKIQRILPTDLPWITKLAANRSSVPSRQKSALPSRRWPWILPVWL